MVLDAYRDGIDHRLFTIMCEFLAQRLYSVQLSGVKGLDPCQVRDGIDHYSLRVVLGADGC